MVQKILIFRIFFFLIFFFQSSLVYAKNIEGKARVIDGDTIYIGETKIRLHGIDAPEKNQKCFFHNKDWECGKRSTLYLKKIISNHNVMCETRNKDSYKRYIGICYINDENINKLIVRNGWAIAYKYYSKDFIKDELIAKKNKLGIWKGSFQEPYLFRKKIKIK